MSNGALVAAIAPHISINAGGASFARVYEAIRAAGPADLYVILGVGHAGIEDLFAGTKKDFETPLGPVATDRAFMDDLSRRFGDRLFSGEMLHRTEHTIEFQTIFLKYVFGDAPFAIAPILTSFPHTIFTHDRFSARQGRGGASSSGRSRRPWRPTGAGRWCWPRSISRTWGSNTGMKSPRPIKRSSGLTNRTAV